MSRYQSQNERNVFGQKYFLKIFLFFQKTKIELLSSEQNERLCNFLNTRLESRLRLVSAVWGDPRARNSMAPYMIVQVRIVQTWGS